MNKSATENYADSDRWLLELEIGPQSIRAELRDRRDPEGGREIVSKSWASSDDALASIQNAVYDNPTMLDDFQANVILLTPRQIWISVDRFDEDEEGTVDLFCDLFGTEYDDVFADRVGDCVNLYAPLDGLGPFLTRTFSGARVSHFLSLVAREALAGGGDVLKCVEHAGWLHIAAVREGRLQLAACHPASNPEEAAYYLAIVQNDGCSDLELSLKADSIDPEEVKNILSNRE